MRTVVGLGQTNLADGSGFWCGPIFNASEVFCLWPFSASLLLFLFLAHTHSHSLRVVFDKSGRGSLSLFRLTHGSPLPGARMCTRESFVCVLTHTSKMTRETLLTELNGTGL